MNQFESDTPNYGGDPDYGAKLDDMVRKNPTSSILWAVGAGIALACVVRALQPRPVENRAARLLEDLRDQLSGLADPAVRRASALASSSASLAQDGAAQLSHLRLDRYFNSVASKLRRLFQ